MNRNLKLLILLFFFVGLGNQVEAEEEHVRVYVDQHLLEQEAIVREGMAYISLRPIFEALGAFVKWDEDSMTASALKGEQSIELIPSQQRVYVNGTIHPITAPILLEKETTFVPLRFISEVLGASVNWNEREQTIAIENGEPDDKKDVASIWIGDSLENVTKRLGQPLHIVESAYSFHWYIYQIDHAHVHIGIENGKVVAFYTNSSEVVRGFPFKSSLTRDDVLEKEGTPIKIIEKQGRSFAFDGKGEWDLFHDDGVYYTLFYDRLQGDRVTAIQIIAEEVELAHTSYFGEASDDLRASYEEHLFQLIQATRLQEKKSPLLWDEKVAHWQESIVMI